MTVTEDRPSSLDDQSSTSHSDGEVAVPWHRSRRWRVAGLAGLGLIAAQLALRGTTLFPESWYTRLADPIRDFQKWVQRNRNSNFVISKIIRPIGDLLLNVYETLYDFLLGLPWFWLPLLVFLVIARSGRWGSAVGASLGLVYVEVAGLHRQGMQTIALMLLCIAACVVIGIPLGIWSGLNPKVERRLRPILDTLQSLPATTYLVPAVLFFGVKQTPAAVATIAFGLAPMVRLTALGIQQVPEASVEAGKIFGSNRRQLLTKVQLPQARASLITGLNQVIMMCLGMVVLAALVGAGGLGNEVISTLRLRSPGKGTIAGLAIVAVAIAFDQVSRSLVNRDRVLAIPVRTYWAGVAAILAATYFVFRSGSSATVPWLLDKDISKPIDDGIKWVRDSWGGGLQSFNDFVVRDVVLRLRNWLSISLAWPVLTAAVALIAWAVKGWKLAVGCVLGLVAVGLVGMWEPSLETLAQIIVAVAAAMAIAVPIGIFVGRRPRLNGVVSPMLDLLQTFPSQVYAIPFVMVFALGYLPGVLATILYVAPAGIRLVALAIAQVNPAPLEAATTFGATNRQRLWGVQVPLALRGIVLGLNQVIMMSLAMVIITGLIGGQGLGYLAVTSLIKGDTGLGVEVGIALVVMAIVLDRLTEGIADRFDHSGSAAADH